MRGRAGPDMVTIELLHYVRDRAGPDMVTIELLHYVREQYFVIR